MPIKPIEHMTKIVANNDASRLREMQKTAEQGPAQLIVQNQAKAQQQVETVQQPKDAEGKLIKNQDEEAEKKRREAEQKAREKKTDDDKKAAAPDLPDPDGFRGVKLDIKA
ncbi:MAG: hypothetical protein HQM09_11970 [Candidatus Riflebacteria bacterium]|nr:hypothetical protein [Candidatus Riflebacteria bacterium]